MIGTPTFGRQARLLSALAVLLLCVILLTPPAASAQDESLTVFAQIGVGTRTLEVTDLVGDPLDSLAVAPGSPVSYRTRVVDAGYDPSENFSVTTENGHLYTITNDAVDPVVVDTTAGSDRITADNLTLGIALPSLLEGVSADVGTDYLLTLPGGLDCLNDLTNLGVPLLDLSVAKMTAVCAAVATVAGDGAALPLEVGGADLADVDLTDEASALLALSDGAGGAFTLPSYLGLGATDPDAAGAPAATGQSVLAAAPPGALPQSVIDAITPSLPAITGVTDVVDAADVVQAMLDSGNASLGTLAGVLSTIGGAGVLDQVVDTILSAANAPLALEDLGSLDGVYTAFPTLSVTAPPETPAGSYAGTHTITLISN